MSFWNNINVQQDAQGNAQIETKGGFFVFPDGYTDRFAIVETEIKQFDDGGKTCYIRVKALSGACQSEEVRLTLNIFHKDEKKRARAWEFAKVLDMNFGSHHVNSGNELTEMSMMKHWVNKPIVLKVGAFEGEQEDGSTKIINYLAGVWASGAKDSSQGKKVEPSKPQAQQQPPAPAPGFDNAMADDIPF